MAKPAGLNTWLHRTTLQYLTRISSGGMERRYAPDIFHDVEGEPTSNADWIHAPDLSALGGADVKYAQTQPYPDDTVTLKTQPEIDAIDAAEAEALIDSVVAQLDNTQDALRAFMLGVLDRFNSLATTANDMKAAVATAGNLTELKAAFAAISDEPTFTAEQLKTYIRSKVGQ